MTSIVDLDVAPPQLRGGQCRVCGFVFFPMQAYGCESCGAYGESLNPLALESSGTVTAATIVHRHDDPRRPAPFQVVQVALDAGPRVRGVAADGTKLDVGESVRLVRVENESGDELLSVRFAQMREIIR